MTSDQIWPFRETQRKICSVHCGLGYEADTTFHRTFSSSIRPVIIKYKCRVIGYESTVVVFTALHRMQTQSSDKNSVPLSICVSNAWIVTKEERYVHVFLPRDRKTI